MHFSMYLEQKLKTLYLHNSARNKICSYIVEKHLPSSKRGLISGKDISVPDREISVVNSTKSSEESEKPSPWRVQKFQFLKIAHCFLHKDCENE